MFTVLEWLPVTNKIAADAGVLARQFRRSHAAIDVVDFVIAATAQQHEATLWTRNVGHFPMLPGLAAPY